VSARAPAEPSGRAMKSRWLTYDIYSTHTMGAHRNFFREGRGQRLGDMASAEREPITGIRKWSPERVLGAQPLVRGSSSEVPEAESFIAFVRLNEGQNIAVIYAKTV